MRKIFVMILVSILTIFCCIFASAEVEYSDEYVSFDYLEDVNCDISYMDTGDTFTYACLTKMKAGDENNISTDVRFYKISEYEQKNEIERGTWKEHFFSEASNEYYDRTIILDSDSIETKIVYKDGSGDIGYTKLLGFTENDFAVASCVINESVCPKETNLCKTMYDTAKITDNYLNEGRFSEENDTVGIIYSNVILSDQGKKYAIAAIDILEKYLAFEIDANTASREIESIKNRSESYSKTSDYIYDGRIDSELYATSLSIDMGSDDAVTETLQDLKKLAHIEE